MAGDSARVATRGLVLSDGDPWMETNRILCMTEGTCIRFGNSDIRAVRWEERVFTETWEQGGWEPGGQ
jgi:hypothetical protein